jgi:hypothetical protein
MKPAELTISLLVSRPLWTAGSGARTPARALADRLEPCSLDVLKGLFPRVDERNRGKSWDRSLGSRGGSSARDRSEDRDPRNVFTTDIDLPRGQDRQPVRERERLYEIDGTESRMLGTIGRFGLYPKTISTTCATSRAIRAIAFAAWRTRG